MEFTFERQASHGELMPDGLDLPDQMAYVALREIYRAYFAKILTREQAATEKRKLGLKWQEYKDLWAFWGNLAKHQTRVTIATECAKAEYRKGPTEAAGLALCDILDGIGLPPEVQK